MALFDFKIAKFLLISDFNALNVTISINFGEI